MDTNHLDSILSKLGGNKEMHWGMLFATIFFLGLQTLSLKKIEVSNLKEFMLSTALYSGLAFFILIPVLMISKPSFGTATLFWGSLFGVFFVIALTAYYYAMHSGPLSYTTFFFSSSMIIPVIAGLIFWSEPISIPICLGILLFIAAAFCISVLGKKENLTANRRWFLLCFVCWFFNGMLSVCLKQHQILTNGRESIEMLAVSFLVASLFAVVLLLFQKKAPSSRKKYTILRSHSRWALCGVALGSSMGNILLSYLSSILPSSYLFPFVLGGVIVSVSIYSVLILKEKIGRTGYLGIILGFAAIVVINF